MHKIKNNLGNVKFGLIFTVICIILSIGVLVCVAHFSKKSVLEIISTYSLFLYPTPQAGGFTSESPKMHYLIYGLIALMIGALIPLSGLFARKTQSQPTINKKRYIFFVIVIFIILINIIQLTWSTYFIGNTFAFYSTVPLETRHLQMIGRPYAYAKEFQKHLPERCNADLISDLDFEKDPGMTQHRHLCYYIYPINIRSHNKTLEPDCLVFYEKKDAVKAIPPGYVLKHQINKNNIVAVRAK